MSEHDASQFRWSQPFRWGLLLAFDAENAWDLPDDVGADPVTATETCLAVGVHQCHDLPEHDGWPSDIYLPLAQVEVIVCFQESPSSAAVEHEGLLRCESGRLNVGDAENERILDVPAGVLRAQVSLFPREYPDHVVLRLVPMATD